MRVVFADTNRQTSDYPELFVGKPQASAAMPLMGYPEQEHRG
jgi:hypothetical protein